MNVLFDERVFKSLPRIVLPCGKQFEPLLGTRFIISEYSRHLFLAYFPLCDVITYVYVIFPSHTLIPYLISECRSCSSERKDLLVRSLVLPRPQIGSRRSWWKYGTAQCKNKLQQPSSHVFKLYA
jgi:hypothetical protein